MNKKVIKIDLSSFFNDERKMVYVLVDFNWKTVACLQKRVEQLFDIDSVRFLRDSCFLPPQESIEIIKFCDDVKAFVPKELQQQADDSRKKRKYNTMESSLASDHLFIKAKRSKGSNKNAITDVATANDEMLSLSQTSLLPQLQISNIEIKSKKSKNKKSKMSIVSSDYKEPEVMEINSGESEMCENFINLGKNTMVEGNLEEEPIKRNTSTPNNKKSVVAEENNGEKTLNDEMKGSTSRIPSSTFLNESEVQEQRNNLNCLTSSPNNPFKKPKPSKAHVYFDESGKIVSPSNKVGSKLIPKKAEESKTIAIFRCPLSNVTNGSQHQKPRIFYLISKNKVTNARKKQVVEIQEDVLLSPLSQKKIRDKCSSTADNIINEVEKQKTFMETSNETAKQTDSVTEKSSLNSTNVTTAGALTVQYIGEEQVSDKDLELACNEDTNITQSQIGPQFQPTNSSESIIMTVDCVDMSIDVDENEVEPNNKIMKINAKEEMEGKHDITVDNGRNSFQEKYDLTVNVEKVKSLQDKFDLTSNDEDINNLSDSDVEEISTIIDLNETESNCNSTSNNSDQNHIKYSIKDITVGKMLPMSTNLRDMPKIGDILLFKVPYKNKSKNVVHTNFMAGKVDYINRRTKAIKVLVVDGTSELCLVPNNLVCNLDDSQNVNNLLQLKLSEMHEPKIFSMGSK